MVCETCCCMHMEAKKIDDTSTTMLGGLMFRTVHVSVVEGVRHSKNGKMRSQYETRTKGHSRATLEVAHQPVLVRLSPRRGLPGACPTQSRVQAHAEGNQVQC